MTRVYSAQNTLMVDHLKHVLDAEGIGCVIRNRQLASAAGRLPPGECWMELWVLDDAQVPLARRIVERSFQEDAAASRDTWECRRCGERLEPQFEACWKCTTMRGAAAEEGAYGDAPPAGVAARRRSSALQSQLWVVWTVMALVAWYLFRSYGRSPW